MEILLGCCFLGRDTAGGSILVFDAHTERVRNHSYSKVPAEHNPESKDKTAFFNFQLQYGTCHICKTELGASA